MNLTIKTLILMVAMSFMAVPIVSADSGGSKLFKKKCKMCHAVDKKKSGPSIMMMSQDVDQLRNVITDGGKKKMMKAYGSKFSADEIDELVAYIRSKQSDDDDDDRDRKKKDKKKHDKKKHDRDDDHDDDDDDRKKDKKKKHDKDDHDDD